MAAQKTLPSDLSESNDTTESCQKMLNAGKKASTEHSTDDTVADNKRPATVCSAPSSTKNYAVTPEIQQTIILCANKKSNSFVENKYRCTITSDRLAQLKKTVDVAVRDHKVFSIKGKDYISNSLNCPT